MVAGYMGGVKHRQAEARRPSTEVLRLRLLPFATLRVARYAQDDSSSPLRSSSPFPTKTESAPRKSGSDAGGAERLYASKRLGTWSCADASPVSVRRSTPRM